MTVLQLQQALNATEINLPTPNREVCGGYAGDLLSFVMGRAKENCAWFTIMTNVNVCAVATLTDVAVVVICEGCHADEVLVQRAKQQDVNVIATDLDVFQAISRVAHDSSL